MAQEVSSSDRAVANPKGLWFGDLDTLGISRWLAAVRVLRLRCLTEDFDGRVPDLINDFLQGGELPRNDFGCGRSGEL